MADDCENCTIEIRSLSLSNYFKIKNFSKDEEETVIERLKELGKILTFRKINLDIIYDDEIKSKFD